MAVVGWWATAVILRSPDPIGTTKDLQLLLK
jgi:hypothetical protein